MAELAIIQKEIEKRQNLAGEGFTVPPGRGAKVYIMGELLSAKNFEEDNLYIFLETKLPDNWQYNQEDYYDPRATSTDQSDLINRKRTTTHVSRCVPSGSYRKPTAHFCFPLCWNLIATEEALQKNWPEVCVQVNSVDSWGRHRVQGYGFLQMPNTPGFHRVSVRTWRPVESLYAEVHSFYLGGSVRVENPWELSKTFSLDEEGEKSVVNRYGLSTKSGGSVEFQVSVLVQTQEELETQKNRAKALNLKQKAELARRRQQKTSNVLSQAGSAFLGFK